jgi:hypothetical protein
MRDLLFGMPFWQENINPRSYNKQEIIDTITRNYQKNRSRNEWWEDTSDVHHMYDDEENPEYESPDWDHSLRNLYMGVLQRFFNTISAEPFKFSFSVANYTCYGKSQYIQEHIHPHCDFVGIHYVRFDPSAHTSTRFTNPASFAAYLEEIRSKTRIKYANNESFNSWMFGRYEPEVVEDDILIHPALLEHDVRPQQCEDDNLRMAIVLNIYAGDASTSL